MLTPEEKEQKLNEFRGQMLAAFGRDPLDLCEITVNDDGTFNMKGKPIRFPVVFRQDATSDSHDSAER
jgi:hypothetical protein